MSACVFFVCAGWRRGRHLNHQLQRMGDRKTPDRRRVGRRPRPDPEPAFEPHSHRSVQPLSVNLCVYIHVALDIQLIVTLGRVSHQNDVTGVFDGSYWPRFFSFSSGETHTASGTSVSYTLAADVGLLTRNIKIVGQEYPNMMKESYGARLLVGTYSWKGIDYKGKIFTGCTKCVF